MNLRVLKVTILCLCLSIEVVNAEDLVSQMGSYAKDYARDSLKNKDSYFNVSVGTWYVNWKQDDKVNNKDIDKDKQIEHSFEIEDSFAKELSINGKWKFISGNFDYILADNSNKVNQYLGKLNFNTDYLDTSMRYIHTKTSGNADGYDHTTLNESHIEFDTTLDIVDVAIFPNIAGYKYLGLGYRYTKYKLPQTIYVLGNKNVTYQGVDSEMQWEGHFVTASYDMSRVILDGIHSGTKEWDWYINALGGYGFDIKPTSKVANDADVSQYLEGETGYFYELEAGVAFDVANIGEIINIAGKVGYRYDYQLLETKKDTDKTYIYAKALSEWNGPFVNINFLF